MSSSLSLKQEIAANTPRYLDELAEFLSIPSISTKPEHVHEVQKCAAWLDSSFAAMNASSTEIHQTRGHPIVTAQFGNDPLKPTVLVYGHYDVQPTGKDEDWITPPFQPTIRDGNIFARGATDDKGQAFTWVKAVEQLQKNSRQLPCNVRFLIEGEEEIGSVNLGSFLDEHPEFLDCDAVLISDTSLADENTPSFAVGTRGIAGMKVTVKGPKAEVHSGVFGGAIANPAHKLAQMLAKITDENEKITLPGIYDDVREYSEEERKEINYINMDEMVKTETGVTELVGEKGYSTTERLGTRPAFTLLSFHSGAPEGENKSIIPATATANLAIRTVPGQDPAKIAESMCNYFHENVSKGVTVETQPTLIFDAWLAGSMDGPGVRAASEALESVFGKPPVPQFCGGSIPVVTAMQKRGHTPILMGFGLESDGLHSPNEHFGIDRFQKGIETAALFLQNFPTTPEMQEKYPAPAA